MDLYDRGMREPLPMFCLTSAAYAEAARQGQDGYAAAVKEWETEWNFEKEDREAEHQMAFGGVLTLSEVLDIAPRDGEAGEGWLDVRGVSVRDAWPGACGRGCWPERRCGPGDHGRDAAPARRV